MSAADVIRTALDDVAPLRVERDHYGDLRLWDDENADMLTVEMDPEVGRLIGLLLAAAPHLAGMLNATERDDLTDEQVMVATLDALDKVRQAVTEAGESL